MIKGIIINPYEESLEYTYLSDELNDKEISIICNCERFVKRSFVNTKTFTVYNPILYENATGFHEHNQQYFKINIGDIPRVCAGICLLLTETSLDLKTFKPFDLEAVEDLVTWIHPSYVERTELC